MDVWEQDMVLEASQLDVMAAASLLRTGHHRHDPWVGWGSGAGSCWVVQGDDDEQWVASSLPAGPLGLLLATTYNDLVDRRRALRASLR